MCWLVSFRSCFNLVVNFSYLWAAHNADFLIIFLNYFDFVYHLLVVLFDYFLFYIMLIASLISFIISFNFFWILILFSHLFFYFTDTQAPGRRAKGGSRCCSLSLIFDCPQSLRLALRFDHRILSIRFLYIFIIFMIYLYYNTSYHCV